MNTLLIDGHNFLFKAYAVPFIFSSPIGTQLQVVSTFLAQLRRAIRVTTAERLMVVFDSDSDIVTDNHQLYSEYKANRTYDYSKVAMSPFDHIPLIKAALDAASVSWIEQPGIEADDVIATLATKTVQQGDIAFIASMDTDFLQLVSERCKIIRLLPQGEHIFIDASHVVETYFVQPKQYVTLKSWVGDKADNINGIPGIGWKRGAQIVNGQRKRELTAAEQEIFDRNVKLIQLNCAVDLVCSCASTEKLLELKNNDIFVACDF